MTTAELQQCKELYTKLFDGLTVDPHKKSDLSADEVDDIDEQIAQLTASLDPIDYSSLYNWLKKSVWRK